MDNELYIAIDIEADGPYPGEYSMLSIGAATVTSPGSRPQETFYIELQPISDNFVDAAMKVNGLDREKLKATGTPPEAAMKIFGQWVKDRQVETGQKAVCVYGPAVWDGMWAHWYFIKYAGYNPFGVTGSGIDLRSYFMGMVYTSWNKTGKREIQRRIDTVGVRPRHTHNAKDDAVELAWFFAQLIGAQKARRNLDKTVLTYMAKRLSVEDRVKKVLEG